MRIKIKKCCLAVNKKNRHSGAGRGEIGAKASAELFNQLHPQIIESSMLTIYKTSELYQEIQRGNWKEEGEIEKLAELKPLIWNRGQRDFPIWTAAPDVPLCEQLYP